MSEVNVQTDNVCAPRSLEEVWDILVESSRAAALEVPDDQAYFSGILEGQLYALAILAVYMGRQRDFARLCIEIAELPWPFSSEDL